MLYTFMDFCAGIGCGRLGLEQAGFQCIAYSEIDPKAEYTYKTFFGNKEQNFGNLMKINPDNLPDFDLLIAGFPCQTFSVMGQRKGMEDPRGQVILGIKRILQQKKTKYFILENVKGLVNHNGGKTLKDILEMLDETGYYVKRQVLNTKDYGLPQSRERIYFLGVRKDLGPFNEKLKFPMSVNQEPLENYLIENSSKHNFSKTRSETMIRYLNNKYNKGELSIDDVIKKEGCIIDTRQSDIRFYQGFSPTLRNGRHGLIYSKNGKLREISGLEGLLLQGIPYELASKIIGKLPDTDLLSQAGNAMSVNVIKAIGEIFFDFISSINPHGSYTTWLSNRKTLISEGVGSYREIEQLETR
ncbi:cytosine-specific methyltransferase [candidate division SR1 bacterium]|nr:cytosine-specific methyltransferase [candidate division SR1 bacterium]